MDPADVSRTCVRFLSVLLLFFFFFSFVLFRLRTHIVDNYSKIQYIICLIPFVISFADISLLLPFSDYNQIICTIFTSKFRDSRDDTSSWKIEKWRSDKHCRFTNCRINSLSHSFKFISYLYLYILTALSSEAWRKRCSCRGSLTWNLQ